MTPINQLSEQFKLRLSPSLRERLRQSAFANRRSINAEVNMILEQALPAEQKETAPGDKIAVHAPDAV